MIIQPQKKSPSASETEEGLMSAADKKKLNGITVSADAVEFSQALTSGTIVGYITINGNKYTLYAPTNTDTKYSVMGGATSSAAGSSGLVPAPAAGKQASFLRGDGTWVVPTNTTYSAGTGLSLSGTTFNHSNSVTAGTAQGDASKTLTFGGTFTIPTVTYDAQGHITGKGTTTMTMPANPNSWRGIQNNLTSDSTTDSLSAAQGKVLKGLVDGKAAASHSHNYAGSSSAGGSATSAVSVVDYGDSSKTIKIGYAGTGATTSNLTHIAGYLSGGTQIKDVSKDTLKSWLGLGSAAYTSSNAYATASHTHSGYTKIYEWTAVIKCATWSRLCYIPFYEHVSGSSYIIHIQATRGNVVYNDTFAITSHHSGRINITRICGASYSVIKIGVLSDAAGNSYVELYDDANGSTNTTTQNVKCTLISIATGTPTLYTSFTDGSTLPSGYNKYDMSTDETYNVIGTFKGSFKGALSGNADTATALTTSAGSATQPVYFSGGKPVATTYTLGASVPSNAKFTDTTYSAATTSTAGLMSAADKTKLDAVANTYALKSLYGDTTINVGRLSNSTVGEYSTAEGLSTTASGIVSHAEGISTTASGNYSHAEGFSTTASGSASHAEGYNATASGISSHAEGSNYFTSDSTLSSRTVTISDVDYTISGSTAYGINSHAEGTQPFAYGYSSHAEGYSTTASGNQSHAEGNTTTASGYDSHAEGYKTTASDGYSHAEGDSTTASGSASHAEGYNATAGGAHSHAEGSSTTASGDYSHAEGYKTTASGPYGSHAEGYNTTASSNYSHAEGSNTTASGRNSHAEGSNYSSSNATLPGRKVTISDVDYTISGSTAYGINSHAEGTQSFAYGYSSHAEGYKTTAGGAHSHAEGSSTTASGNQSHAEGVHTTASSIASHAEGGSTTASGNQSHAEGYSTTASNFASHAGGHFNASMTDGGGSNNTTGTAFVIGNGTSSAALANAFSVQFSGVVKAKSTITASTTADYAEFFEWLDENPDEEDRVGYFVTLDGDKIRIATNEDDYILGVVSGEPFVLGNGDCDTWNGMFLRDEFRRTIYEPAPKMVEILDSEGNPTGEFKEVEGEFEGTRPKLNPEYDNTQAYISRFDRKEWSPVGMLGVLAVRHDGTAQVNGYVTVNADGIATACTKNTENSYRVIKSNSDSVVEIIFR